MNNWNLIEQKAREKFGKDENWSLQEANMLDSEICEVTLVSLEGITVHGYVVHEIA